MSGHLDIVTWAESRAGFYVDRAWSGGRWRLGWAPIKLAAHHRDILRHVFTPDDAGRYPYDVVAWAEPAKSGKTALAALCAEYAAVALGQNASVIMASNSQRQAASLMYKSLCDSVMRCPALGLEPNQYTVTIPHTGNVIKAIPSNSRTAAGERFIMAVFDELAGYQHEDAERLWSEHKVDPTQPVSMRLATGYAGYSGESVLWQDLLESGPGDGEPVAELAHITNDGQPSCWRVGRTFVFWSHVTRQPWQTPAWLASQEQQLLPAEYRRMILCEFAAADSSFLPDLALWDRLADPALRAPVYPTGELAWAVADYQGWRIPDPVVIALDAATSRDNFALAVVGRHPDPARRDTDAAIYALETWQAPAGGTIQWQSGDPAHPGPEDRLLWWLDHANVVCVTYDPYQLADLAQRRRDLVWFKSFDQGTRRLEADTTLHRLILRGGLAHNGDATLREHVQNAAAHLDGQNRLRLVKKTATKPIDGIVACSMAIHQALNLNL